MVIRNSNKDNQQTTGCLSEWGRKVDTLSSLLSAHAGVKKSPSSWVVTIREKAVELFSLFLCLFLIMYTFLQSKICPICVVGVNRYWLCIYFPHFMVLHAFLFIMLLYRLYCFHCLSSLGIMLSLHFTC